MPTKTQTARAVVSVTKFTDSHCPFTVMRDNQPLQEFVPVSYSDYSACGSDTPLRDAVARFIGHLEDLRGSERVTIGLLADESGSMSGNEAGVITGINDFVAGMAQVKEIDPATYGKVLAVIVTDGWENSSREISAEALAKLIREREADGWTFIYLGANQDAWNAGTSYGFSGGMTGQTVTMDSHTPQAFASGLRTTSSNSASYLSDNASYLQAASTMSNRSISEDGTETARSGLWTPGDEPTVPDPPKPVSPYQSAAEAALKQARETLGGDEK